VRLKPVPVSVALSAVFFIACGSKDNKPTPPVADDAPAADPNDPWAAKPPVEPPADRILCERLEFAKTIPIAEASGAAHVPATDATPAHVLVVGDSGTVGQFVELDPESGAVLHTGHLPLDKGASDDLEGLTRVGETLYTITSSGFVRHHRRAADGTYTLAQSAYPIGDPPATCADSRRVNCGRNYEGLCLSETTTDAQCTGFAVSKTDGAMYCLELVDGKIRAVDAPVIAVAKAEELTGCSFADAGFAWVGANMFGGNAVYRARDWSTPASAQIDKVGADGPGFSEAIAAGPSGVLYRFSDDGGAPSLAEKYVCE
jgi:hypothetical protein